MRKIIFKYINFYKLTYHKNKIFRKITFIM